MNSYLKSISILAFFVLALLVFGMVLGDTFNSLVISFVAAYFIFPLIARLERWGIPRSIVVALTTFTVMSIIVFLGIFLVPMIVREITGFLSSLPHYFKTIVEQIIILGDAVNIDLRDVFEKYLEEKLLLEWIRSNLASISRYLLVPLMQFSKTGLGGILHFLLFLINLFIIPIFFYFLIGSYENTTNLISDLFPPKQRKIMSGYLEQLNVILNGYFRGQLMLSIFLSTYFSISLSLLGVKFGLLIGICTGILNIIPYVGVSVSICLSIISVLSYSSAPVFDIAILFLIYGIEAAIEAPFIYPRLVGRKVNLRPIETMLALAGGANVGGLLGVLVAIPVAASMKFVIIDAVARYRSSSFYQGKDNSR